ncbi:hypothetical protein LNP74_25400 [Klebsiella pneumoniae subsp. pneumoniae]|nr:hypothetical protein [Klebsiella pneumoniae subsp. pneumoniae]
MNPVACAARISRLAVCCSSMKRRVLDARSIATLFELCERLEMQLIIAAPGEHQSGKRHYL